MPPHSTPSDEAHAYAHLVSLLIARLSEYPSRALPDLASLQLEIDALAGEHLLFSELEAITSEVAAHLGSDRHPQFKHPHFPVIR